MVDGLTPDDALEGMRGVGTDPKKFPLKEDNDTPATPSSDPEGKVIPKDHQGLDSNVEESEAYSEGLSESSEEGEYKPREV